MRCLSLVTAMCVLIGANGSSADVTIAEGKTLFGQYCAVCHGDDAKGEGRAARSLETKPADLTRIAARRDGVWPMLEVMSIIDGYTKQFNPRADMPVIPELSGGRMIDFDTGNGIVTPAPARLVALVEYLEAIQSPRPESYVP